MEVDPNAPALDSLGRMLRKQLELQSSYPTGDPRKLVGNELAEYVRWNILYLEDELHEAMREIKLKPWYTDGSQGTILDRSAFVLEICDAFHFMMNLLLAVSSGWEPEEIAAHFAAGYDGKAYQNAKRQEDGYTKPTMLDGAEHIETPEHMRQAMDEHLRRQRENVIKQTDTGSGSHDY